jgi:hypothetical protein
VRLQPAEVSRQCHTPEMASRLMRALLLLIPIFASGQAIKITPSAPVVNEGASLKITADRPVSFSLSGTGALTGTSTASTTFKAPNVTPQHVLNGCMVLPSDSVFNTRIDKLPVHPSSGAWAPFLSEVGIWFDYAWGTNVVDNSTLAVPQTFYYTSQYNDIPFQIPTVNKKRETGANALDGNNDHHVLTLNRQTCQFYETYQDSDPNAYCSKCTANSGYTYRSTSYTQPGSGDGGGTTDAAGLPLAPLTVHLSEILAGEIIHAMRFTTCLGCISNDSMWPAVGSTGAQPGAPPMGARFRLKSSFDISSYPPAAQVVLTALKQYGMFLADIGSEGHITMSSDVTEDPAIVAALNSIGGQIGYSNFEVVDESSFILSSSSHQVNPANPYQSPANYASLIVTDKANPMNRVVVPIVIQPALVGTPDPAIVVQAGTPAFNVPYWVNGSSNHGVIWTISPSSGAGSITSSGSYTAPAVVSSITTATITATSVGDPNASTSVAVTIIPPGQIRIDSGSMVSTVDDNGNTWLPDLGFETGSYNMYNDRYGSNYEYDRMPNGDIWSTSLYTWGDDIVYRFHVPNGNYKVAIMSAVPMCSGTFDPTATFDNGLTLGPVNLVAQRQIGAHNYDFGIPSGHKCRTPSIQYIPAVVNDTNLTVSLRVLTNAFGHSIPIVNGLVITPDSSAPHLVIDTQQQTTVPAGTSLQLYMVNWYAKDMSYYYQVTKGSGTIKGSLFTAPAGITGTQLNNIFAIGYTTGLHTGVALNVLSNGVSSGNKTATASPTH